MPCGSVSLIFSGIAAERCPHNMHLNILFLSRWFPYPANNGSKLRIYNLLRGLSKHHDVTLLSFADQPGVSPDAPQIQEVCSDVHVVPWREYDPDSTRARFGFLSFMPRSLVDTFSPEMADRLTQLLRARNYDLVVASQLSMASYHPYFADIPALFEEVEIGLSYGDMQHSLDWKTRFRRTFTWFKLRMYLSRLLGSFQACTVVSERERGLLTRFFSMAHDAVEVIPNCVSVDEYESPYSHLVPNQLIFSGPFRYHANYEAMLWFIQEVYPRIRSQVAGVHLVITGDHANLPLPSMEGLTLAGYVEDIKPLVASSCVSIAPLLSGGGTRLKILEAMALGTPVVSTSKGAEGLDAINGEHLLIGDDPVAFADSIVKVLTDNQLRTRIAAGAHEFVKEKYNWNTVLPRFLQLVEHTAGCR